MKTKAITQRLQILRKTLDLSQKSTAAKLKITPGYYNDIEKGRTGTSANFLSKLSSVFRVSIDWLLTGHGEIFLPKRETGERKSPFQIYVRDKEANYQAIEGTDKKEYPEITEHNIRRTGWFNKLSGEQQGAILTIAELKDKKYVSRLKEHLLFQLDMEQKQ